MNLRRVLLLAALLALAGCATFTRPQPEADAATVSRHLQALERIGAFSVAGRMAVQTDKRGFSGGLRWHHTSQEDRFALYSPLGAQVADIHSRDGNVTLTTSDRKSYSAANGETLLQQTMGWGLPLDGLPDWVLGRPTPGAYESIHHDAQGRLARLKQHGWDIEYAAYHNVDGIALPAKILLRSPQLDLKLLIERWGTLEEGF